MRVYRAGGRVQPVHHMNNVRGGEAHLPVLRRLPQTAPKCAQPSQAGADAPSVETGVAAPLRDLNSARRCAAGDVRANRSSAGGVCSRQPKVGVDLWERTHPAPREWLRLRPPFSTRTGALERPAHGAEDAPEKNGVYRNGIWLEMRPEKPRHARARLPLRRHHRASVGNNLRVRERLRSEARLPVCSDYELAAARARETRRRFPSPVAEPPLGQRG